MSTKTIGNEAETRVAEHLKKQGHKILARNWSNRWCEIDIVSRKYDEIFFVEVKYRQSAEWGGGLEAINTAKLRRMTRAAEAWVVTNKWHKGYQLLAASVNDYEIDLVEINTDV